MKRIFFILFVCFVASLSAMGQEEVFIYKQLSRHYYEQGEEGFHGWYKDDNWGLRVRFGEKMIWTTNRGFDGEYHKREDGSFFESPYRFCQVGDDGNIIYERSIYPMNDSMHSELVILTPNREKLIIWNYYKYGEKKKLSYKDEYIIENKGGNNKNLPSWVN